MPYAVIHKFKVANIYLYTYIVFKLKIWQQYSIFLSLCELNIEWTRYSLRTWSECAVNFPIALDCSTVPVHTLASIACAPFEWNT